jgi:hypothetical protein
VCKNSVDVCHVTCSGEGACKSGVCCPPGACQVEGGAVTKC